MLIGMVLSAKETIVPFIEGEVVRIYNSDTREVEDAPNPALEILEGRRAKVVNYFYDRGVSLTCSPPGTHCEISYENAVEKQMRFYRLTPNTSFTDFQKKIEEGEIKLNDTLLGREIEPSKSRKKQ